MMKKAFKICNINIVVLVAVLLTGLAYTDSMSNIPNHAGIVGEDTTLYIIQLRKHTNPKVIQTAKNGLMQKYPERTFLTQVQPPNHTLSIGYFSSLSEAEEFKKNLEKDFPGCTILPFEKKK